jgi:hypothetical protein
LEKEWKKKEGIPSQVTRYLNKKQNIKITKKIRYKIKKTKKAKTIRIMKGVKSKNETRRNNSSLNLRL